MGSYFQIRNAERMAWYISPEIRNIADVAAMVTEALDGVGKGEKTIQRLADHAGVTLRPISAEQFNEQFRGLPDSPEESLMTELDFNDEEFCCVSWNPREKHCVIVSGMLSRFMKIYELAATTGNLDVDTFNRMVWEHLQVDLIDAQREDQEERWESQDISEAAWIALPRHAANLVAAYEELLRVPAEECVTCYFGDLDIHAFGDKVTEEQAWSAYEKALAVMEMDSETFQAERQFISHGGIISAMRDRLLAKELKPGETVLFVGTEPYGGPGDFDLRGGIVESVDPSERTCSVRGEFFTMHDVPLHYVLGRYDTSVEGEHYGFPHVRPLFGENRELADQYLREAEASWNAQQAETQTDSPQLMM